MSENKLTYEEYMYKSFEMLNNISENINTKINVLSKEFVLGYQDPQYIKTNLLISKDSYNRAVDSIIESLDTIIKKSEPVTEPPVPIDSSPKEPEKPKLKPKPVLEDFEDEDVFDFEEE